MDRRELLKRIAAISVGAYATPVSANSCNRIIRFGASKPAYPIVGPSFYSTYPFRGLGRQLAKEGKNVFLWKFLEKEIGEIIPHYQGPDPETGEEGEGDCVGQSAAMGCDVLAAADIHLRGEAERFVAKASVEMLYAGSRVEVGKGQIRGGGGSHGGWMAGWLTNWGVLHRLVYDNPDGTKLDLTGYHPARSRKYRDVGVPDWLEPIAKEHPVKMATNVRTGMEGVDAICAGHPVITCSSYAFHPERDARGFCVAYGAESSRRGFRWVDVRVQWWHAMIGTGVVFYDDTIGVLIQNSHGLWNSGPQPFGIPGGSFFVDLPTWEAMITDWGDCWAIGSYTGHEGKKLRKRIHRLWR